MSYSFIDIVLSDSANFEDFNKIQEEQERKHVASGIECYMKQFDVTKQHVYGLFN